ncbi:MAG TPA: hypothetical protein PKE06_17705, partial [Flavilitoribacter sp.]|nr:hypothetical protein [Flavilitoribacter sp.]
RLLSRGKPVRRRIDKLGLSVSRVFNTRSVVQRARSEFCVNQIFASLRKNTILNSLIKGASRSGKRNQHKQKPTNINNHKPKFHFLTKVNPEIDRYHSFTGSIPLILYQVLTPGLRAVILLFNPKCRVMLLTKWKNRSNLLSSPAFSNWVDHFFRDDDLMDNRWFGTELTGMLKITVPKVKAAKPEPAKRVTVS